MGYRTQPDGGAKTLAELGLTAAAQQIDAAAAAVAAGNAAGGTVILDGDGKVPAGNLPAAAPAGAETITLTVDAEIDHWRDVHVQVKDAAGNNVTTRRLLKIWASEYGAFEEAGYHLDFGTIPHGIAPPTVQYEDLHPYTVMDAITSATGSFTFRLRVRMPGPPINAWVCVVSGTASASAAANFAEG